MKIYPYWLSLVLVSACMSAAAVEDITFESENSKNEESTKLTSKGYNAVCNSQQLLDHPVLCEMVHLAETQPELMATELYAWAKAHGGIVEMIPEVIKTERRRHHRRRGLRRQREDEVELALPLKEETQLKDKNIQQQQQQQLPVVLAHGMGDSCFNHGMQDITQAVSKLLGNVYTVCIPTGASQTEDTKNGYFLSMDENVDIFAAAIRQDPHLHQGFHAIGFSQGNNVIRGYLARYNTPTVNSFLSINGVNAGIGAVPYCRPELYASSLPLHFSMCDLLMEQASHRAYTEFSQKHSFQANYWRDPRPSMADLYHEYSQLAVWGNEGPHHSNATLNENYGRTQQFVWVMATEDGMVWPKEGEQWGAPDPQDPFHHILPMKQTDWYQQDLFGLRTAEEAGKNCFESFEGDHLQFKMEDFERWVKMYLTGGGR